ncbi:YjzC family protein [Virgibacillus sp. C22-A2]|uniref:YjzC family protein n=1 Tax=Virgibacillus tibetensis TaxID=3042313 RepID=A0ABU6KGF1_9BACI|nr:YjzC family protein [Virgibacillus sp. C22-A2]
MGARTGVYKEIGETGTSVSDPKIVTLKVGEKFPQTSNQNRFGQMRKTDYKKDIPVIDG